MEQADKNREVHKCFNSLTVVGSSQTGTDQGQKRGDKRRRSFLNVRNIIRLILLPQKIDTHHYAVLAIRKSLNAVIAGRAERLSTPVTLHDRNVLTVIGTIHYFLSSTNVVPVIGSCVNDDSGCLPFQAAALCSYVDSAS